MSLNHTVRVATPHGMAGIWAKLLGHESFGYDDNFFDVGGHSLLANRLFSELELSFGVTLPVVTIFDYPTIGELVREVNAAVTRAGSARPGGPFAMGEMKAEGA